MSISYSRRGGENKKNPKMEMCVIFIFDWLSLFVTFFFKFTKFSQLWLHGHAELMRHSTQVQQMFGLVITARIVGKLAAFRTSNSSNFKLFSLLERKKKSKKRNKNLCGEGGVSCTPAPLFSPPYFYLFPLQMNSTLLYLTSQPFGKNYSISKIFLILMIIIYCVCRRSLMLRPR